MSIFHTLLRLGVIVLLALPVVECQTGNSSAPPDTKKASDATAKKAPTKKAADAVAKKAAEATANRSQANAASAEATKAEASKANLARPLGNARLDAVSSDYANISLTGCQPYQPDTRQLVCDGKGFQAKVNDGLRAQLKSLHVGDVPRVEINDKGELQDLRGALSVPSEGISPACRLIVLAASALLILGLATAVTKGSPLKFIVGMDNRYSNSKFQLALWFWILMSTYIATVALRVWYAGWDFFGGVNTPQNLLVLSGLSVLTYGGAKAITTAKVNAAANPAPVAAAVMPPPVAAVAVVAPAPNPDPKNTLPPGRESLFRNLVQNDLGGFDFGDFQMLVVTLVAVVMYLMLVLHFLRSIEFLKTVSLPDVDTTILAGFGLGQGAYLAKKAAGNVGTT